MRYMFIGLTVSKKNVENERNVIKIIFRWFFREILFAGIKKKRRKYAVNDYIIIETYFM